MPLAKFAKLNFEKYLNILRKSFTKCAEDFPTKITSFDN